MSAINGLTFLLLFVMGLMYLHFKGKVEELLRDVESWRQGYVEINTKLRKAEKIIMKLEKNMEGNVSSCCGAPLFYVKDEEVKSGQ